MFASVTPLVRPAETARGSTALLDSVEFYFDGMVRVVYGGLAPGSAGLCQFNVEVPRNVSRNDIPLRVTVAGEAIAQIRWSRCAN